MYSRFFAFAFSLIPGAGLMYLGLMRRGAQFMVLFFAVVALMIELSLEALGMFALPVIWFYSFFDSLQTARRLREGERVADEVLFPVSEWRSAVDVARVAGWGLIGLGVLALLRRVVPYPFLHRVQAAFLPALLILAGVYVLRRAVSGPPRPAEDVGPTVSGEGVASELPRESAAAAGEGEGAR